MNDDKFEKEHKIIVRAINQILNTLFTFFWWIFFTPCTEINSGLFVCGANSFLTYYRDLNNCN